MKKILFLIFLSNISNEVLKAQGVRLSSSFNQPFLLNPAMTGSERKTALRLTSRIQGGRDFGARFVTNVVSFELPFCKNNRLAWAVGALGYRDDYTLDGQSYSQTVASIMGSLTVFLDKYGNSGLSAGGNVGMIYRRFGGRGFSYDAQYDEGFFDTGLNSQEASFTGNYLTLNLGAGLFFFHQLGWSGDNKIYAGAAVDHANSPRFSYAGSNYKLPLRFNMLLMFKSQLHRVAIKPEVQISLQKPAFEITPRFGLQFGNPNRNKPLFKVEPGIRLVNSVLAPLAIDALTIGVGCEFNAGEGARIGLRLTGDMIVSKLTRPGSAYTGIEAGVSIYFDGMKGRCPLPCPIW